MSETNKEVSEAKKVMPDVEEVGAELKDCGEKKDFGRAIRLVREYQHRHAQLEQEAKKDGGKKKQTSKPLSPAVVKDALKQATEDRVLLSFVDGVEFGSRPLVESLARLEQLVAFNANIPGPAGVMVLNETWGLGVVRKIDYFYRRITVDFKAKKGHQFTYAAACDMLSVAPKDHILVLRETAPADFEAMLKERPADLVKAVIRSNGSSMTLVRLEDYCVRNGFVKSVNWKKFWDGARASLKSDKCVELPAKKTDPIRLRAAAEDYGESWVNNVLAQEKDPKRILALVDEFVSQGKDKFKNADETTRNTIGERLSYAITGARSVDDALYARLASCVTRLGYLTPSAEAMRGYLWDRRRYIKAAETLPAREVGAMISFLACDGAAKAKLYEKIPEFCYAAVYEIVTQFGGEEACRKAIADYMNQPKAPATLTTLLVGKYEQYKPWTELPPLITLLTHAIALGEGRQNGETLRMQNIVRRLFASTDWLKKVFAWLKEADDKAGAGADSSALFFERFQASIAWDPSTHHAIVVRMTKIVPALEAHLVKVEKKKELDRLTSFRSFGLRKAEYLKLINEDMPANVKRIEFAKSYGDLSENAEYQYAKDEQRALMQKQTLMQAELEAVKPADFASATTDEVMPGVTVVCDTNAGEKTWTILGEWDNDLDRGIISSKARVAQNLMGKKPGDNFELPDENGDVSFATIREIRPLTDEIREWMKLPDGLQV